MSKKGYLLKSSASAALSSLNVLPYEPILSYLLFLKIFYNNIPRTLGLVMDLKHLNLKMRLCRFTSKGSLFWGSHCTYWEFLTPCIH